MKVEAYIAPATFDLWRQRALDLGFLYCASGPLVRSSYKAGEAFIENVLKKRRGGSGSDSLTSTSTSTSSKGKGNSEDTSLPTLASFPHAPVDAGQDALRG